MAEWIKFDGSEEHKKLIEEAEDCRIKDKNGCEYLKGVYYHNIDSFLICEPHPHRDMIIEWANTGRPVYCKNIHGEWRLTTEPSWTPEIEYSFDPPKEKIRYRVALMSGGEGAYTCTFHSESQNKTLGFIKWLTDWQEVEIDG